MSAGLGGLSGTLSANQVLSEMERLQRLNQEALARQAQAASQGSQEATSAYQQAAAEPAPQLNPADIFLPTLVGNIASILGGNPDYRQSAQEGIKQKRSELLQARAQNLQALRDTATQKAELAQRAGDLEAQAKAHGDVERLNKTLDVILKQQEQAFHAEQGRLDRASRERIEAGRQQAQTGAATDELEDILNSVESGQTEITNYPIKQRPAIVSGIARRGGTIFPKKVRDTVNTISGARGVVDELKNLSALVNTASGPAAYAMGLKKMAAGAAQDPDVNAFNAARQGFLATISRATGERGVLTDQDAARARALLPTVFSSKEVAAKNLGLLENFLTKLENRAIQTYTTKKVGGPALGKTGEGARETSGIKTTGKLVRMIDKQGKVRTIDAAEVPDAISKGGWKRAPAK